MTKIKNLFKSTSGKDIVIVGLSNDQKTSRPLKYVVMDADLVCDVADKRQMAEIGMDETIKYILINGIKSLDLDIKDYNIQRTPDITVRNESTVFVSPKPKTKPQKKPTLAQVKANRCAVSTALIQSGIDASIVNSIEAWINAKQSYEAILKAHVKNGFEQQIVETVLDAYFEKKQATVPAVPQIPQIPQ